MNGYQAFLNGIKPAYMAFNLYEQKEIDHLKALGYPHVFIDHDYGGSTIFFANEKQKQQYIKDIDGLELNSREEIIITGRYLGYPPVACRFFADYIPQYYLSCSSYLILSSPL